MADPQAQKAAQKDDQVQKFAERLSAEEKMLVILKGELYEGNWSSMLDDLQNRLAGRPYIFKLADRIAEDIERIEKLRDFEKKHQVDLSRYIEQE